MYTTGAKKGSRNIDNIQKVLSLIFVLTISSNTNNQKRKSTALQVQMMICDVDSSRSRTFVKKDDPHKK
ncbi:hypothetical protein [Christiangramia gaetbulicola]|uniref:hypothetical protein n=1 Tax=Christiangramia gaetbulicola TaxID=703340 RepID=UPI001FE94734|nr:hypothetical protein [Christiangramia gaetbulicola]